MKPRAVQWSFIAILLLLIITGYISIFPSIKIGGWEKLFPIRQGLDLQGGLQVLMESDVADPSAVTRESMDKAKQIIESRVNALGVTEPVVQLQGNNRISVELPGISNVDEAIALVKQTALLEFVSVGRQNIPAGAPIQTTQNTGATQLADGTYVDRNGQKLNGAVYTTELTGADLKTAGVISTQLGKPEIQLIFTDEGAEKFARVTAANVGNSLAIVLDGVVLTSPTVQNAIPNGQAVINGTFTPEEANQLALALRFGSLPIPLKVVNSRTVGATLGQDSVDRSLLAGIIGFATVGLFMMLYYRLPGVVAVLALLVYAAVSFALFKLIPITLTLPGIAGFILSLGVAVDGNILIFERMKEELRNGRSLRDAVDTGFRRAWDSIRDSNVSSLITCTILFIFGSAFGASIVKGFALTLAVGVLVGLFTSIFVTRTFLHVFVDRINFQKNHSWFGL
ncbi:MAG TPA: protein translocase subunit SecD [Anaerolineales bacterium]|nr:protein translocase subunit SecD [Anaerolineales bacterium]